LPKSGDAASRFSAYVEGLASVIGHADRAKPLRDYCVGLMMPCERKSVEPSEAVRVRPTGRLTSVGQGLRAGMIANDVCDQKSRPSLTGHCGHCGTCRWFQPVANDHP
jgi:SRSO17 transposase